MNRQNTLPWVPLAVFNFRRFSVWNPCLTEGDWRDLFALALVWTCRKKTWESEQHKIMRPGSSGLCIFTSHCNGHRKYLSGESTKMVAPWLPTAQFNYMKGNKPRPDKIGLADEIVKRHANLPGQEAKPIRGSPAGANDQRRKYSCRNIQRVDWRNSLYGRW